jgi:endoplasmic reticulum lectin 1
LLSQTNENPESLLKPLANLCARHADVYWEYEFCYNRYVRQFHEGKEDDKRTEYMLGKHQSVKKQSSDDGKIKTWFYNGVLYPYHEVIMSEGTLCDLTQKPRKTRVRFICLKEAPLEFIHFSEITTCEYLVVVATQYLCQNPIYRSEEHPSIPIECHPVHSGPEKPKEQVKIDDQVETLRKQFHHKSQQDMALQGASGKAKRSKSNTMDERHIQSFFLGEDCLVGGQGWWKHEVCYGKHVKQFHFDANGRTEVLLGTWNSHIHDLWYRKNKERLTKYRNK